MDENRMIQGDGWTPIYQGENGEVLASLNSAQDTPRGRSKSLANAQHVLVPEVGTASDVTVSQENGALTATTDDLYISGVTLRRGFAAEFMANLQSDVQHLFQFEETDFEGESERQPLKPVLATKRQTSVRSQGSISRVVVTFLKSMVGSYILYTPKMFRNGGLAAGIGTLLLAAWVACNNMVVLLRCAAKTGKRTFGQVGMAAFGRVGLLMVDVSLVLSQLSFCCTYFIFIAKNVPNVMPTPKPGSLSAILLDPDVLVALQLLVYIPMAWIRKLSYMAVAMFLANICMWLGLLLITAIDVKELVDDGYKPVMLYNPAEFILFMGAVVVCFEGIGLVLPLRDSLEVHLQAKFPGIVQGAMLFLAIVFSLFASLGYLAYGEDIQTFVTMNIPKGDPVGALSVALYSVAIMMSYPLQLFPAIKCLESHLLGNFREKGVCLTWIKNSLRAVTVLLTAVVAKFAGPSFDNFAGLIGGVCAVPLALIYPSAFQLALLSDELSVRTRCWTWVVLLVGIGSAALCTWESLSTWK